MTLSKLQDFLKDYGIAVIILAVIIIGFVIFLNLPSLLKENPNPVFGNLPTPFIPNTVSANFQIPSYLDLPVKDGQVLPVYKIKKRGYSESEAATLAEKLGFSGKGKKVKGAYEANLLVWREKEKGLEINLSFGSFFMRDNTVDKNRNESSVLSTEQAVERAEAFLKEKGLEKDDLAVAEKQSKLLILGDFEIEETTNQDLADAYEINFVRRLGNYDVTSVASTSDSSARVQVGKNGKVVFIFYQYTEIVKPTQARYLVKNRKEFVTSVAEKKIKVPGFSSGEENYIPNPDTIFLNKVRIVFYDDGSSDFLQPIFVVDGNGLKGTARGSVRAYLPAISDKYLINED